MRIIPTIALVILLNSPLVAMAAAPYSHMSGGITSDERAEIDRTQQGNYSLKLLFARPSGELQSDVRVTITDSSGQVVVDTVSDGPYFLVALPEGSYTATGQVAGEVKSEAIKVAASRQKSVTLRFSNP